MRVGRDAYVYIMSNAARTLYAGVTADLERRAAQHRMGEGGEVTKKYTCTLLVWREASPRMDDVIAREKVIKGWSRAKKVTMRGLLRPSGPVTDEGEWLEARWPPDRDPVRGARTEGNPSFLGMTKG